MDKLKQAIGWLLFTSPLTLTLIFVPIFTEFSYADVFKALGTVLVFVATSIYGFSLMTN